MSRQESTILIDRPPGEVFAYMDDVAREREWQPNLKAARQDPPGQTEVGSLKSYTSTFMGRTVQNTYEVKELEAGRRIVCETTPGSTVEARSEILCESEGAGTRVTMVVDAKPKGALRLVPKKMLESASREELEKTLRRLKKRLEA